MLNKQGKVVKGKVVGGIEWTKTLLHDGTERQGYTWNPIKGCFHACGWTMPDGTVANCYAEDVAQRVAGKAYPQGFEHHYWKPELLEEPVNQQTPSRIFVGSMTDLFGHWVPNEQITQVLEVCVKAPWHTFQFLTKNPVKAAEFVIPHNAWIGASSPPDFMWNKPLSNKQKMRMLHRTLEILPQAIGPNGDEKRIHWMSAEPLSWNITPILSEHPGVLDWIVIGAASSGKTYYPPDERFVRELVDFCDATGIKVFFKGNLRSLPWAAANWREDFPAALPQPV